MSDMRAHRAVRALHRPGHRRRKFAVKPRWKAPLPRGRIEEPVEKPIPNRVRSLLAGANCRQVRRYAGGNACGKCGRNKGIPRHRPCRTHTTGPGETLFSEGPAGRSRPHVRRTTARPVFPEPPVVHTARECPAASVSEPGYPRAACSPAGHLSRGVEPPLIQAGSSYGVPSPVVSWTARRQAHTGHAGCYRGSTRTLVPTSSPSPGIGAPKSTVPP